MRRFICLKSLASQTSFLPSHIAEATRRNDSVFLFARQILSACFVWRFALEICASFPTCGGWVGAGGTGCLGLKYLLSYKTKCM